MNAQQRRVARRKRPVFDGCGVQGYSGITTYPDLMCIDGYMRDMDADGWDPSVSALPCKHCLPDERVEWDREREEENEE